MTSYWAPYAQLPEGLARDVRFEIADGRFAAVVRESEPGVATRLSGVVLPGFANCHSHAFHRALRGRTHDGGGTFWTWRERMYALAGRLDPDRSLDLARATYAELALSGVTSVGEFHYLHHAPDGRSYADPAELSGRIIAAAARTGIGLTLLPCFYRYGGFRAAPPTPGQRRFVTDPDGFLHLLDAARHHLASLPGARLGIAPHSLRAVSPADLRVLLDACPTGPVHIHAAEQTAEVADAERALGAPPVAWLLHQAGVDSRWCLIHATHMRADEIAGLARSGAVAGLCPLTEANLGDGIFPGHDFVSAGGRFGIGSDSNVMTDPAAELRQLETSQRLLLRGRNVLSLVAGASTGRFLLDQALAGGAQALDQNTGAITPGRRADIVVLDARHPDIAARTGDAWLDTWLFAAPSGLVRDVIAGGRQVVRGGRHVAGKPITAAWRDAMARLAAA